MTRNGTNPRIVLEDLAADQAGRGASTPPSSSPPAEPPPPPLARWAATGTAAKVIAGVAIAVLGAIGGAIVTLQSAATHSEVRTAIERLDVSRDVALERHEQAGHELHLQRLNELDARVRFQEGESTWQSLALEAIADKLHVRLPPRPRHQVAP